MDMSSVIQFTKADRGFGAVLQEPPADGTIRLLGVVVGGEHDTLGTAPDLSANSGRQVVANSRWR
jgi:hypothetical protein